MDPYAGSGTTGHAVLELNMLTGANRRFILIEQGSPDRGDKYARSLTQVRLRRALTGERPTENGKLKRTAEPLSGGFQFRQLTQKIDSRAVLTMKKDELIDLVITSHWDIQFGASGTVNLIQCMSTLPRRPSRLVCAPNCEGYLRIVRRGADGLRLANGFATFKLSAVILILSSKQRSTDFVGMFVSANAYVVGQNTRREVRDNSSLKLFSSFEGLESDRHPVTKHRVDGNRADRFFAWRNIPFCHADSHYGRA